MKSWTEVTSNVLVNQTQHHINIRLIEENLTLEGHIDPITLFDAINWEMLADREDRAMKSLITETHDEQAHREQLIEANKQVVARITGREYDEQEIVDVNLSYSQHIEVSSKKIASQEAEYQFRNNRRTLFYDMGQMFGSSEEVA